VLLLLFGHVCRSASKKTSRFARQTTTQKVYVDGTLGAGGHAIAMIKQHPVRFLAHARGF
jgi:16S rRNA C1402 N4-methylase RsmH